MTEVGGTVLKALGDLSLGPFRKAKPLLMLAYLALEGPAPRRQLRALLWPQARQPESSLRVALHTLREACPGVLNGSGLLACGVPCDAALVLALRGAAALAAYGGPFLHGVPLTEVSDEFLEWAELQRARLARHVQGEALALAEGSAPGAAAHLAERIYRLPGAPPAEPETLHRLLALTRPGDPLETELRAELRELTGPEDLPGGPARRPARMLGRGAELDRLLAWAAEPGTRLAVVSGPGGIGKSTLARELLRELSRTGRDVTLVDAEGASSAGELLSRLAQGRAPGQAVRGTWAGVGLTLGPDPVVLLDGVDDLPDLPDLVRTLGAELPTVRWVLTGRRHLGRLGPLPTPGSVFTLPLGGLDVPPPEATLPETAGSSAVTLFVREAARVRRGFTLDAASAPLTAGLTRRLMGHPLALALAASWLRVEALEAVYARVLQDAAVLVSPGGDGDGRRGLMLVAERSWTLLSEAERYAALRLSACADLDPADAPALGVSEHLLDALLAHSFLEAYQPGSERLRLYPALTGLLRAQAELHPALALEARQAHARHHLTRFAAQAPEDPAVDTERGNLLLAVVSALEDGTLGAAPLEHLLAHYDRRGLHGSGTDVFAALVDRAEDAAAPGDVQAAAQIAFMWLAYRAGRLLDAQTLAARFLQGPLAEDAAARMKVLNTLGSVRGVQGQMQAAAALLQQALALARQVGDGVREVSYRMNLLSTLSFVSDTRLVRQELVAAEGWLPGLPEGIRLHGRRLLLAVRMYLPDADLAALRLEAGALTEAGRRTGDRTLTLSGLLYGSRLALRLGHLREAELGLRQLRGAMEAQETTDVETELALLETQVLYARGRTPQARRQAAHALSLSGQRNNPWQSVELLLTVAADLSMTSREELQAWLAVVVGDENLHFEQRERARQLLGGHGASAPTLPLDLEALRDWLRRHLPTS